MNNEQPDLSESPPVAPVARDTRANGREPGFPFARHERQPGFGYGNSGGYGATLHFLDGHADPMFRLRW